MPWELRMEVGLLANRFCRMVVIGVGTKAEHQFLTEEEQIEKSRQQRRSMYRKLGGDANMSTTDPYMSLTKEETRQAINSENSNITTAKKHSREEDISVQLQGVRNPDERALIRRILKNARAPKPELMVGVEEEEL